MTVDMPCDCTHPKDGHAGLAYACWTCDCKRYTPDIQTAAILAKAKTMPTDAASARLRRVQQEHGELLSIVARIGDALSPTGERPQEALGTLAADVEAFVALHDVTEAELVSARAELQQLRAQLAGRGAP